MFKFNFGHLIMEEELDDGPDGHEEDIKDEIIIPEQQPTKVSNQKPCEEIALEDLIERLSPAISYTPSVIPARDGGEPIVLPRRDLYDARYQIISEQDTDDSSDDADDDELYTEEDEPLSNLEEDRERRTETGTDMDVHINDPNDMNTDTSPLTLPHRERRQEELSQKARKRTRRNRDTNKLEQQRKRQGLDRIQELQYIDAPSDVVPNIYEGGLKTWECSIDVVHYLSHLASPSNTQSPSFHGRSVLEVGCGTSVPTSYILQSLLNEDPSPTASKSTLLHVQDYNRSVLELVTLPNLLLAWYSSNASLEYRSTIPEPASSPPPEADMDTIKEEDEMDQDPETTTSSDPRKPGDVDLTPPLLDAFRASLAKHHITLRFSAGSWDTFVPRKSAMTEDTAEDGPYDLIITSETIYRMSNVPSLLATLRMASAPSPSLLSPTQSSRSPGFFSSLLSRNKFPTTPSAVNTDEAAWTWSDPLVLVAAKVLYFGVGGSVDEFESMAQDQGAIITVVHETNIGVGRKILRLSWS